MNDALAIQKARQSFFALRDGMMADTLRKGGIEYKYMFGLQLPQIKGIADSIRPIFDADAAVLAQKFWNDRDCRESRLLACHLMPASLMTREEALGMARDCKTREEADILAFRVLRHADYAAELLPELEGEYIAEAIGRFID